MVKLERNAINSLFTFNVQETTYDGGSSWRFGEDFSKNYEIFGFGNSSSLYIDYSKK